MGILGASLSLLFYIIIYIYIYIIYIYDKRTLTLQHHLSCFGLVVGGHQDFGGIGCLQEACLWFGNPRLCVAA